MTASAMRLPRAVKAAVAGIVILLLLAALAWGVFVHALEQRVLQALGPRAHVGSIHYAYPTLELLDTRITAEGASYAWPAEDEVKVARVTFETSLSDLWAAYRGQPLRIAEMTVEDGTLSMLRTSGHLVLLPALREQARNAAAGKLAGTASRAAASGVQDDGETPADGKTYPRPGPPPGAPPAAQRPVTLFLEHIHLEQVNVELFDATVNRAKPYRLLLAQGRADIANVALPAVAQPMTLDLQAAIKGNGAPGRVAIKGSLAPGEQDAHLAIDLAGGDLVMLQPYLLRFGEGGVKSGRLDLQLDTQVTHGQLHAPGHLAISNLQFDDTAGTFVGIERRALLAALTKNGRLDVRFTLEGRLDDPKFALNEKLGGRIAVGLAEAVGISVKGVVQGLGDAVKGLLGGRAAPARKP